MSFVECLAIYLLNLEVTQLDLFSRASFWFSHLLCGKHRPKKDVLLGKSFSVYLSILDGSTKAHVRNLSVLKTPKLIPCYPHST
jgi:hypothetical protein